MSAAFKYCVMQTFAIPVEGQAIDSETETHEVKPMSLPRPITAKQTAEDAFEALDEETQGFLRDTAMDAISRFDADHAPHTILQFLDDLGLESEHRLALWCLLPSKLRSSLKKAREEQTHQKEAA